MRRRYKYLPWLILIFALACVLVFVVGIWLVNPSDIFQKATQTATVAVEATATALSQTSTALSAKATADSPTATVSSPTATEVEPTDTLAPLPSFTPTVEPEMPTQTATATDTPPSEVITPIATLPPSGTVILEDEFDAVLGTNWLVWGQPRPVIEQGFGDNYLSLKSPIAADAGVTSKAEFALEPDVEMNFRAQLQPGYSQYPLIFSWDPKQHVREPGNNEPGVLQVEISLDKVMISSALTSEQCVASIRGVDVHDYLLRIVGDNAVDLYVDGEAQPACALTDIGMQAPIAGRITFRWMGLVSSVMVTSP